MEKLLIVRVMMAGDWHAAFVMVSQAAFRDTTDRLGVPSSDAAWSVNPPDKIAWENVRQVCRLNAEASIDPDLAAAWWMLGADPAGPGWRKPESYKDWERLLAAIGKAIATHPVLLDDAVFRQAVAGWRFLERAGSDGEDNLIVCAKVHGAHFKTDRDELLAWARIWSAVTP
jgi:hypothetical protein